MISNTKNYALLFMPVILLLAACSKPAGPGPEIHDTKYVAVGDDGHPMAAPADNWPCVLDQYTGLLWEVRSEQPGLHHRGNTYSWYDPNEDHGSEEVDYRGTPDGGQCAGSACDTWELVQAVNAEGYCGYNDWRLPMRDELGSISDPRKLRTPPTINTLFFPDVQQDEYWSGNDYHFQYNSAWAWSFQYGQDRVDWKKTPKFVRLVRGEAQGVVRIKD